MTTPNGTIGKTPGTGERVPGRTGKKSSCKKNKKGHDLTIHWFRNVS